MSAARWRCSAQHDATRRCYVIGAPQLTESYALALARSGRKAVQIDGAQGRARRAWAYVYREQERQHA